MSKGKQLSVTQFYSRQIFLDSQLFLRFALTKASVKTLKNEIRLRIGCVDPLKTALARLSVTVEAKYLGLD